MKEFKFGYGIQGYRFFVEPTIREYAFNPGDAELKAYIKLQSKYPGRYITHFRIK